MFFFPLTNNKLSNFFYLIFFQQIYPFFFLLTFVFIHFKIVL